MATRVIRDALLDSERYWELAHDSERLLFFELLLSCDDYGCVPLNYTILRRRLSSCSAKTKDHVTKMLSALADVDLVRVYEYEGSVYGFIPRTEWRPQALKPKWPRPPASIDKGYIDTALLRARNLGRKTESQAQPEENQQLSAVEQCGNSVGTVYERPNTNSNTKTKTYTKPEIQKSEPPKAPPKFTARATRLPDDWIPLQTWLDWTAQNCPGLDSNTVAQVFADYWHAVPGTKGTKLDWFATWRNWCRQEASRKIVRKPASVTEGNIAAARRFMERQP